MSTQGGQRDPWDEEIIIFVKQQTGKTLTLKVRRVDTIADVKNLIALRDEYPPSSYVLKANGVEPADDELLLNLNVGNAFTFTNEYRI